MIISAHYLTLTRLCRAEGCEQDAENYSRLCWQCARKDAVRLHVTPPPAEPSLYCSTCKQDKPDDHFPLRSERGPGGRSAARRGRFYACELCVRTRKLS